MNFGSCSQMSSSWKWPIDITSDSDNDEDEHFALAFVKDET